MLKCHNLKTNEFQNSYYLKLVSELLLMETISNTLSESIVTALNQFDDLRFYFYRNVAHILKNEDDAPHESSALFLAILLELKHVESKVTFLNPESDYTGINGDKTSQVSNPISFKKSFSDCWIAFLGQKMNQPTYIKILEVLHVKVIPKLVDPMKLMDFLVDAYNSGLILMHCF